MKLIIFLAFSFALSNITAQNFFINQLDHFFPNRKSKQIERLTIKNDSLSHVNDSLSSAVTTAAEKIVHLKKEIILLKTDLYNEKENSQSLKVQLEEEVSELLDSITKINFTAVNCTEEAIPTSNSAVPKVLNKCIWRHYQFIEIGIPDNNGRYVWSTDVYDLNSGSPIKINNTDLFKTEKLVELEAKINVRFEEDYNSFKASSPGCFYNKKSYTAFTLSQMRIALNDNSEILFEADFGLADTCFPISSSSTGFKINELREFLKD